VKSNSDQATIRCQAVWIGDTWDHKAGEQCNHRATREITDGSNGTLRLLMCWYHADQTTKLHPAIDFKVTALPIPTNGGE